MWDPLFVLLGSCFARMKFSHVIASACLSQVNKLIKDTYRENTPSSKTEMLTKSMNMYIVFSRAGTPPFPREPPSPPFWVPPLSEANLKSYPPSF